MKIKRLLAFLISVAVIVGMVPTFVFADTIDFEAEEPAATESSEAEEDEEDEDKEEPSESDGEDEDDEDDKASGDAQDEEEIEETIGTPESAKVASKNAVASGTIGNKKKYIKWSVIGDTLYISGNRGMPNWSSIDAVPWHAYRGDINYIQVYSGVSSIGISLLQVWQ